MLEYLRIENLILIDRAEIRFGEGLNILTGESGQSFCLVIPDYRAKNLWVRIEPYGRWSVPIVLKPGKYVFEYYLGLPFSKGRHFSHL